MGCAGRDGAAFRVVSRNDPRDRKSTRLNSSHLVISYAVFCLKKKKKKKSIAPPDNTTEVKPKKIQAVTNHNGCTHTQIIRMRSARTDTRIQVTGHWCSRTRDTRR